MIEIGVRRRLAREVDGVPVGALVHVLAALSKKKARVRVVGSGKHHGTDLVVVDADLAR